MNYRIVFSIELIGVIDRSRVIAALADNPLFFARFHVALEGTIIVANHATDWVKETIADVVSAGFDEAGSFDVVHDKRLAIRSDTLEHLSVELAILLSRIVPILILERQVVIEEIVARDELSTVPLGDISTLYIERAASVISKTVSELRRQVMLGKLTPLG